MAQREGFRAGPGALRLQNTIKKCWFEPARAIAQATQPFQYKCFRAHPFLAVRECVNKSAASAPSLDYVKFQAVIKSAASTASSRGGRASG